MRITNELGLPEPFVQAVSKGYGYKEKRYSVTQILKGTREAILERRHAGEITADVSDMVWLIFGTAVHSILENAQETDTQLKENYITADMQDGYTLSGIFDLYDEATGMVTDYKTATVWKVIYGEWDDYRMQLLIYAWMLRGMGFDVKGGQIVALLKDHSKGKARREADYPKHPVYVKSWQFTDEDFADIEAWLWRKFEDIKDAEGLPDDELPMCTPDERWAKPGKWAVMKKGRKSAVKLWDNKFLADTHAESLGSGHYVEHRPGSDGKCSEYCNAAPWCSYWKERYGKED